MIKKYAAALATCKGKILLGKRSAVRKEYPGVWDVLGGHCRKRESFEAALIREFEEEAGVVAKTFTLWKTIDRSPAFVMAVFHITEWSGTISNNEPVEHDLLSWFNFEAAVKLVFPDPMYAELLKELALLAGSPTSGAQ